MVGYQKAESSEESSEEKGGCNSCKGSCYGCNNYKDDDSFYSTFEKYHGRGGYYSRDHNDRHDNYRYKKSYTSGFGFDWWIN